MIRRKFRRLPERTRCPFRRFILWKTVMNIGRNILEKILRLRALENCGVLAQFVRDLVDDEVAVVRERLIGLLPARRASS